MTHFLLIRRLASTQTLAVDPGPVKTTGTALAEPEHVAGIGEALLAGLGALMGSAFRRPVHAAMGEV